MDLKFSLLQMSSGVDVKANVDFVCQQALALDDSVDCLLLPECALHFCLSGKRHVFKINDLDLEPLQVVAQKKGVDIIVGGQAIEDEQTGSIYNSVIYISQNGERSVEYKKIHLFEFSSDDKDFSEGSFYEKGIEPVILDIKGWKVGMGICFDLRFPTLSSYYFEKNVDVLLFPAAFLKHTGLYHWHPLLRARAIETQAYVLASAQVGCHKAEGVEKQVVTYGHTLAVGPWGQILKEKNEGVGTIDVKLSRKELEKVRSLMPIKRQRSF